ncbi:MAG TPA: hypothetical protein VI112_10505 [Bacteroidia bacterium]
MKKYFYLFCPLFVFLLSFGSRAQEQHFADQRVQFRKQKVKERLTVDMLHPDTIISRDVYDTMGNKTEAYEYYAGKRKLDRFDWKKGEWIKVNDSTHFSFRYDAKGRMIEMEDHDFTSIQNNYMYEYDMQGNIDHWVDGRTFQSFNKLGFRYDSRGNINEELYFYWRSRDYRVETKDSVIDTLVTHYYLTYDKYGNLVSQLANGMERMGGTVWYRKYDPFGKILAEDERGVWSYFGVDHEHVTMKDTNQGETMFYRSYEYYPDGKLRSETKSKFGSLYYSNEFIYDEKGKLVREEGYDGFSDYIYDMNGLLKEKITWWDFDRKKMKEHLKYQYKYW